MNTTFGQLHRWLHSLVRRALDARQGTRAAGVAAVVRQALAWAEAPGDGGEGAGAGEDGHALSAAESVTPGAGFAVGVVAVVPCRYRACPGGRIHRPGPSPRGHRHSIA